MAEYIDRAEAINLLWLFADESCASVVSDFENLPTIMDDWIPVEEKSPPAFFSVLGHMTDAGPFPPVRECYSVGRNDNQFYFPALGEFHPVSHWKPMPEPPEVTNHEKE